MLDALVDRARCGSRDALSPLSYLFCTYSFCRRLVRSVLWSVTDYIVSREWCVLWCRKWLCRVVRVSFSVAYFWFHDSVLSRALSVPVLALQNGDPRHPRRGAARPRPSTLFLLYSFRSRSRARTIRLEQLTVITVLYRGGEREYDSWSQTAVNRGARRSDRRGVLTVVLVDVFSVF